MKSYQSETVNISLIDDPQKAIVARYDFRNADVDNIYLCLTTYALSSIELAFVSRVKVPVIILNLSTLGLVNIDF